MTLPNSVPWMDQFHRRFPRLAKGLFHLCRLLVWGNAPPQLFNFVGGRNFDEIGRSHFQNILRFAGVGKDERILDIGCGIGRVARHFASYLSERARYDGFDVVHQGISWCQSRFSRRLPQFRFVHVDVYNKLYNPTGRLDASSFRFPYDDASFDFVFATSVLTHLLPDAAINYLREMARVLDHGGRCFVTFFIIDDESKPRLADSPFPFRPHATGCWVVDVNNPETAIAYEKDDLLEMYEAAGLHIVTPIHFGDWTGRQSEVAGQDIIVARKH
ncbi:MAG: methyltransferase [Gemmatales bacterium]|nr:MAG: methyltransferase [Gemmatales bacterium]